MRVLFFGTHPKQFNGYSKVVYELTKCHEIFKSRDIDFCVYGFQKFYENPAHRRDVPDHLTIYDAFAHESPRVQGFGFTEVRSYVNTHKPDVCIIYNDMVVLHNVISQLKLAQKEDGMNFKIIAYIDQIYLNQKAEFIEYINNNVDHAILFTPYWEKIILEQDLKVPTSYLQHGFNPQTYFPVPKKLARKFYNLSEDDFVILNLNRNQPRKRWDICLKAFAEIVSRHSDKTPKIKLIIATAVDGGWNLIQLYERELKKRNLTLEQGMKHIVLMDRPQQITDEETNILYNTADIGINTCDGEGFGLCNFEQAGIGIPQVVSNLGGFIDFFDSSNAILCDPKMSYYVDNTRDTVCGEALLCDYNDFVEGIETYYFNKNGVRDTHGQKARERIVSDYKWSILSEKLCDIIKSVYPVDDSPIVAVEDEIEKISLVDFSFPSLASIPEESETTKLEESSTSPQQVSSVSVEIEKIKKNEKKKDKEREKERKKELKALRKRLEELMESDSD